MQTLHCLLDNAQSIQKQVHTKIEINAVENEKSGSFLLKTME
jgi:NADH:ubiquinone oxidoreductase subunit E